MAIEFLKELFGDKALTYAELESAVSGNEKIKPANLADGGYVDKGKFDAKVSELAAANQTITQLQTTVKKFDGVDVDGLKKQITDAQSKYDTDIKQARFDYAIDLALRDARAKNPKAVKALLDLNKISLDGEKLIGLSEQLEEIRKTDDYQFHAENAGIDGGTGKNDPGTPLGTKDPANMTMDEYIAFRRGQN